ncbi:unnamed protein product [Moneuplotes crassus]|uniref:Uncharacterized protein n=1 Tax=Euplotes crassus TaxID=5936 RepID=A0AAD1UB93_EUPCR|nr:unnamed protein product [Moneuplotes crassus]
MSEIMSRFIQFLRKLQCFKRILMILKLLAKCWIARRRVIWMSVLLSENEMIQKFIIGLDCLRVLSISWILRCRTMRRKAEITMETLRFLPNEDLTNEILSIDKELNELGMNIDPQKCQVEIVSTPKREDYKFNNNTMKYTKKSTEKSYSSQFQKKQHCSKTRSSKGKKNSPKRLKKDPKKGNQNRKNKVHGMHNRDNFSHFLINAVKSMKKRSQERGKKIKRVKSSGKIIQFSTKMKPSPKEILEPRRRIKIIDMVSKQHTNRTAKDVFLKEKNNSFLSKSLKKTPKKITSARAKKYSDEKNSQFESLRLKIPINQNIANIQEGFKMMDESDSNPARSYSKETKEGRNSFWESLHSSVKHKNGSSPWLEKYNTQNTFKTHRAGTEKSPFIIMNSPARNIDDCRSIKIKQTMNSEMQKMFTSISKPDITVSDSCPSFCKENH